MTVKPEERLAHQRRSNRPARSTRSGTGGTLNLLVYSPSSSTKAAFQRLLGLLSNSWYGKLSMVLYVMQWVFHRSIVRVPSGNCPG